MNTSNPGKHTLVWLYLLAISVWGFLYLILNNITDWDLWGVMSFGALLDQNPGTFPYTDPFSYTAAGQPWIYHEWGSGVVFYQVFKHWGSAALFWLKLLLVEGLFVLACLPMLQQPQNASRWRDLVFGLILAFSAYLILPIVSTTIRCQLFTFAGYAVTLLLLERHRQMPNSRGIWILPFLIALWVNLHGGFITGLAAIGVYTLYYGISRQWKQAYQLAVIGLSGGLCTLLNPYGFRFISTMVTAWTLPRTGISEWGNVFSLDIPGYGLLYSILLIAGLGLGMGAARQKSWHSLLLIGLTGAYGWMHYKLAPVFLITLLMGADTLLPLKTLRIPPHWNPWANRAYPLLAYGVPVVLMLTGGICLGLFFQQTAQPFAVRVQGADTVRGNQPVTRFAYPVEVVRLLRQHRVQGNIWAPFSWGEFLYWTLYPNCRVAMDGRYETIYPPSVYADYRAFYFPPYDITRAERYATTHILVETRHQELLGKLSGSGRWHAIYQDSRTVLFAKQARPAPIQVSSFPEPSTVLDDYRGDLSRFHLFGKPF